MGRHAHLSITYWELSGVAKRAHYSDGSVGPWVPAFTMGGR